MVGELEPHQRELLFVSREIMLPTPASHDGSAVLELDAYLARQGVVAEDRANLVRSDYEEWRSGGEVPTSLRSTVDNWLVATNAERVKPLSGRAYFKLHYELRTSKIGLGFDEASRLLSYADLIGDLAIRQRMSASQISVTLAARGQSSEFPWMAVQKVMREMKIAPIVTDEELADLFEADQRREVDQFADARWAESLEVIIEMAANTGISELGVALETLVPESAPIHWPYVYILHTALMPISKYDHPPIYAYEFQPRSEAANEVFGPTYKPLGGTVENPILNNAKSIAWLGPWWSDSKWRSRGAASRPKAHALVQVLTDLSGLSAPAKTDLGEAIRAWCLRQVRLRTPVVKTIAPPNMLEIDRFLPAVSAGNTLTRGVLEQRVVDAVASTLYDTDKWRPRGILDSVNAANLPRRKLGDCEFQDSANELVHAFEAHGGTLTRQYAMAHLETLGRVIPIRIEDEWAPSTDWQVEVTFIAHAFGDDLPPDVVVADVPVRLSYVPFAEFIARADRDKLPEAIREYVLAPLNEPRTPENIRARYLELIAP